MKKIKLEKNDKNESGSDANEPKKFGTTEDSESPTKKKTLADMAGKLTKKPPKPKAKGDGFSGGLSKDFESFDILWFDISTKVRQLVIELC